MSNTITSTITGLLGAFLPGLEGRGEWVARLRQASFRGAPFQFESASGTYGRRYAMHQYPGRDVPYAEDLGRTQRTWQFAAYVIGGDYLDQRAALLAACEQAGPGDLVLPLIGTVQAVCTSVDFADQRAQGGYSALSLSFSEAGQPAVPNATEDTQSAIETSADSLTGTEQSSFLSFFGVSGTNADVARAASTDVTSLGSMLNSVRMPTYGISQAGLVSAITSMTNNASTLVENPSAMFNSVDTAFSAFTDGSSAENGFGGMLAIASRYLAHGLPGFAGENEAQKAVSGGRTTANIPLAAGQGGAPRASTSSPAPLTPAQATMAANATAFQSLARRLALREMAYNLPGIDLDNTQRAEEIRTEVVTAFQGEIDAAAVAYDDDAYAALTDLEHQVVNDLDIRAAQLPSLTVYNTPRSINAIVLAYQLYADANRNLDIVARVGAINPAFMPRQGTVLDQ